VLFVIESIGFGVIMGMWKFVLIDEISNPDTVREMIAGMSSSQRSVHAWTTATLDIAYPLTYGPLFAGLSLRVFKSIFAVPALATMPVDLAEGVVQVLALTGNDAVIWLKAYVTPLKLGLFLTFALGVEIWRRRKLAA